MAMDTNIRGISGLQADVNANNELKTALTQNEDDAGFVLLASKMGKTTDPGGVYVETVRASDAGRLAIGTDQSFLSECFPGSAFNTAIWTTPTTTMTATVAGNFANLNAGLSVASGGVAQLRTWRHFPIYKGSPTIFNVDVQFTELPVANNVCELGMFIASGTAAPTDGAFFRINAAGELRCVLNTAGTETQSSPIDFATYVGINNSRNFRITFGDQEVDYYIDDVHAAGIELPNAAGSPTGSMNLPAAFRNYNSAAASAAQVMKIGGVNVTIGDLLTSKPWPHLMAGAGGHCSQGQTGGTMGSTSLIANSSTAVAAVPTNTTAALGTGLGGIFQETDTLAVGTDGIISSYQVPAGTAAVPGKSLYITRVTLSSVVNVALTGGGYGAVWYLAYGHTNVSLATAESATAKQPRRMVLGTQGVASGATLGTVIADKINLNFDSPIVVQPGEFVQLVKRKLGTAPTAGALVHSISIGGYWE